MTDHEYLKTLLKVLYIVAEDPNMILSKPVMAYLETLKNKERDQLGHLESKERVYNIQSFFIEYFQEDLNKFGVKGEISKQNKGFIDFLDHIISKADLR